ncbi:CDP-alcohol phosphatidyltransferase family protein [Dongia sedimenti]|uniref:CDP-alcohol phosphatidyltransferase family protein n=1 Tax=Dongia sedimenti TaxID=3064282 RepID=A0ABU0YGG3_9PROT|nr:CDP-alcohol phosphatidyltransferase family protein [Rhodospirillaceae bacterium R-7]
MLDRAARRRLDPLLERWAARCIAFGLSADAVTMIGFGIGLVAMLFIAAGHDLIGLALLLLNRTADGIDGAVARRTRPTERGGYLDIVLDFILYAGVPFAFAVGHPEHALAAAFLIFAFVGTGTSFLAFAIFKPDAPRLGKAFHYLGGLTEGTETIAFFALVLLFPSTFAVAAWIFGALCWVTTLGRIGAAMSALR